MKIVYITAGAAGMYCGTCMHDNTLASALIRLGHEVALTPTYTPLRTDEHSVAVDNIFFGAINVYLQQKAAFFRHTPWLVDRLLDRPGLLNWVSRFAASTSGKDLGALTLSMLQGEEGRQRKELDKLVCWLEETMQPEVVHLSQSLFLGFARRIRERLGVPVVCSLQGEDIFLDELPPAYREKVRATMRERVHDVDGFTAPCRYYARLMGGELCIPPERLHVARLGVDARDFAKAAPPRDPQGPVVVGYLARICREKGLHVLVEAFRRLAAELPPGRVRLRVAGYVGAQNQAFLEAQRRYLEAAGLGDQVDWVGEVDRQGKVDFLHSLDVFSVPTVYREPKGLFALEAMASGLPVVVPEHGAFPELLATGGGVLVEPESPQHLAAALRALVDDPAERRRLGREGRAAVQTRYDETAMAAEMLAVYRRVQGGLPAVVEEPVLPGAA